LLYLLLDFFL